MQVEPNEQYHPKFDGRIDNSKTEESETHHGSWLCLEVHCFLIKLIMQTSMPKISYSLLQKKKKSPLLPIPPHFSAPEQ